MKKFYEDVIGYLNVKVISLSPGSIIVNHVVNLSLPASGFNTSYEQSLAQIKEQLDTNKCTCPPCPKDPASASNSCLSWNKFIVTPNKPNLTDVCYVKDEQLKAYYVAAFVDTSVQCISPCNSLHPHHFQCGEGACQMQPKGPTCFCPQSGSYWFSGPHCEQRVSKVGLAVGVALGLALLLLLLLALAALLCWRRWRSPGEKGQRLGKSPADEEAWYENSPEWRPPETAPTQSPASDSPNDSEPSRSEAGSSPPEEGPERGTFRPRLDKVDTSLQARIARPQVTRL
ncbi:mucin-3A [Anolis carolinensis]|uniref:mucin-3A n=1 Tax=Anolis carolinensis TaxID=28377 RepID=UPI000462C9DB|nr:PREDICTED: mucin-3B [Anolis carolinensis]|eukprot:XP_008122296.1 PREDICTED: mucin-3B [Anolis carolinensis]